MKGKPSFEQFLTNAQQDFYRSGVQIKWVEDFYQHCINHLMPQCDTKENAQQIVAQSIERRRSLLKLKS